MGAEWETVYLTGTTDGSGDLAVTHTKTVQGFLYAVRLIDGTFADGVDITLTCESASLSIPLLVKANFNTDSIVYPRVLEALNTDGTALSTHCLPLLDGKPKMVIAQGGNTLAGGCVLYVVPEVSR